MIQFIRPRPKFQIPASIIAGWLAGSSPESCGDESVHTFGNLRASSEVRSLSIPVQWGQKPSFHSENFKVAPSVYAAKDGSAAFTFQGVGFGRLWILAVFLERPYVQIQTHNRNMRSTGKLHYHGSLRLSGTPNSRWRVGMNMFGRGARRPRVHVVCTQSYALAR
eukprot:5683553-Prymnesium_polylepis.1